MGELTLMRYAYRAQRTARFTIRPPWVYAVVGLAGEVGELVNVLKRGWAHRQEEREVRLQALDEAGDVLWYLAVAMWDLPTLIGTWPPPTLKEKGIRPALACALRLVRSVGDIVGRLSLHLEGDEGGKNWAFMYASHCLPDALQELANLLYALDLDWREVAAYNLAKLEARYGLGNASGGERD